MEVYFECMTIFDCLTTTSNNKTILKTCYYEDVNTHYRSYCDCEPFYGLIGKDCDKHSIQSIYFGLTKFILIIWTFITIIYSNY